MMQYFTRKLDVVLTCLCISLETLVEKSVQIRLFLLLTPILRSPYESSGISDEDLRGEGDHRYVR